MDFMSTIQKTNVPWQFVFVWNLVIILFVTILFLLLVLFNLFFYFFRFNFGPCFKFFLKKMLFFFSFSCFNIELSALKLEDLFAFLFAGLGRRLVELTRVYLSFYLIYIFQFCLSSFYLLKSWPLLFYSIFHVWGYSSFTTKSWIWNVD